MITNILLSIIAVNLLYQSIIQTIAIIELKNSVIDIKNNIDTIHNDIYNKFNQFKNIFN